MKDNYAQKVQSLLRRHGYKFLNDGGKFRLVELAIAGFTSERIMPDRFNTLQGIIDKLCWLCGADFSEDYHATFPNA
jgi:uncharacterized protein (DUF1330 family)